MVTVSVIIPNYNRAQVIGETIANMLQQTLPPHQLIVVDDGSTDDSVDVIKSFGDRVTLIQQPNRGPGAARNAGLRIATGEFIQFMDSDDLASLNKLEVQAQALTQHQADIVYGPWAKAWMRDRHIRLDNVVLQQNPLPSHRHPLHWFLTSWSMVFQQCLVRRSALEAVGDYREDMRLYEDGELFVRLLISGTTLIHEAQSLTLYRLDDYGKLTAPAQQPHHASHAAQFYDLAISQLKGNEGFHPILHDPEFRLRVWQALQNLQSIARSQARSHNHTDGDRPSSLHPSLEAHQTNMMPRLRIWLQQKRKGLQQKVKGHRWSTSYQPVTLTHHHRHLIQELNLMLTAP